MDRNYTFIGIACVVLALLLMFWHQREAKRQYQEYVRQQQESPATNGEAPTSPPSESAAAEAWERLPAPASPPALAHVERPAEPGPSLIERAARTESVDFPNIEETFYTLENDFIKLRLTNRGAAIKDVALKRYSAIKNHPDPYIVNAFAEHPALSMGLAREGGSVEEYGPVFRLSKQTTDEIVMDLSLAPDIDLVRTYSISRGQAHAAPYLIEHTTRFINRSDSAYSIDPIYLNVGTAAPTAADPMDYNLNFGYYNGDKADFLNTSKFTGGSFLGFFKRDPADSKSVSVNTVWASVKNQFFTTILSPEEPGIGVFIKPVKFPRLNPKSKVAEGITGSVLFDLGTIQVGTERELKLLFYAGPKEYARLSHMNNREDLVMEFGFLGLISKMMLFMLVGIHKWVGNYGLSIVILTIIIRLAMWPLTAKAAQSSKKMAKIQAPMKALQEKYRDRPERLQKETLKLFREHQINPVAGCLPIVVQLPIFLAFFYMLRSASELRFASFLWIGDLSLPDTVARISGVPLNPLPLIMGVSMFYQMRLTPTTMDKVQQRIFQFMPFIFLIFLYNFQAGLVLYWTISNFFSILQQLLVNRSKDSEPPRSGLVQQPARAKSVPKRRSKPRNQ